MAQDIPKEMQLMDIKNNIYAQLSKNGQIDKIQAMITSLAMQSIPEEESMETINQKASLKEEMAHQVGIDRLSIVLDYLNSLGLSYTSKILEIESGIRRLNTALTNKDELARKYNTLTKNSVLHGLISRENKESLSISNTQTDNNTSPGTNSVQNPKSKETEFYISNWENRTFERINQVEGQMVAIEDLKKCKIYIYDALDSLTMDACIDCELIIAGCEGSVFIRECKNTKITAACKQLRIRDSARCQVYLFTSTDPVIETSHHIDFYPFNVKLPKLVSIMKQCKLDPSCNRFVHVYDFSKEDQTIVQPHVTVHYPTPHLSIQSHGIHHGTPIAPREIEMLISGKLQPALSSEAVAKGHDIKTGGQVWKNSQSKLLQALKSNTPLMHNPDKVQDFNDNELKITRSSSSKYSSYSDFEDSGDEF